MSDIEIIECEQGSHEWHQARAGYITASMFGEVMKRSGGLDERQQRYVDLIRSGEPTAEAAKQAGYKSAPRADKIEAAIAGEDVGDWTAAAYDYAFRLAIERISGEPLDEGFTGWAAQRGHELEPEARAHHAMLYGLKIERAGFVRTTEAWLGASADGLIGDDGGSEYKCLIDPAKLRTILIDRNIDDYLPQIQGCMYLTGRKWWHFGLYCPALEAAGRDLIIIPVKRDDDYIESMESSLVKFDRLVEDYRNKLKEI